MVRLMLGRLQASRGRAATRALACNARALLALAACRASSSSGPPPLVAFALGSLSNS